MARTLPGSMGTAVQAPVTSPGYLVYVGFSPVLRHSTRADVSYGGYTWTGGLGTTVVSVDENAATIDLRNTDLSASAIVLNTVLVDIDCEVYQFYGSDVLLVFSGYLDGAQVGSRVRLTAKAMSVARKVPNKYITYPTFKHLLPPGTTLTWAQASVTLGSDKVRFKRGV